MVYGGDEDATLLRFLRARKLDIAKSLIMLQDTIAWREKEGVNNILTEVIPEETLAVLYRHTRGCNRGYDRQDRPVYFDRPGCMDVPAILEEGVSTDMFLRKHIQEMEYSGHHTYFQASMRAGRTIDQTVMVMDVSGVKLSNFTATVRETFGRLMAIDQDNYPESNAATYIINSGYIFSTIFSAVSLFLDVRTRQKVNVLGNSKKDRQRLDAVMDLSQIPEFCGGDLKDSEMWNSEGVGEEHLKLAEEVKRRAHLRNFDGLSLEAASLPAYVREMGREGTLEFIPAEKSCGEDASVSLRVSEAVVDHLKKSYCPDITQTAKSMEIPMVWDDEVMDALHSADRIIAKCAEFQIRKEKQILPKISSITSR
eukprot:CAMPEP_0196575660 /NCGR_PEP_ID=MMETSP1081-20130531/5087_1 /TAXON_ID=36882 /ORGANISM="Pyramimonas amylifera, Strain CCMP720" /LENGTH=367 /DNA_ID=CAMNT_0041894027 /DNA_START=392 /DNA_END=1495 /DNA_ORIENTATION=+